MITNATSEPIHVARALDCGTVPLFSVAQEGTARPWALGECTFTCEQLRTSGCACPASCAEDSVLRIDANASFVTDWPAQLLEPAELTEACTVDECGPACSILRQAPDATYEVAVEAGTDVACDPGPCADDCLARGDGWCQMRGRVAGTPLSARSELTYPDDASLEIVFR